MSEPTTAAGDALLTDLIQDHEAPSYHVIERVRRGILAIEAEARAEGYRVGNEVWSDEAESRAAVEEAWHDTRVVNRWGCVTPKHPIGSALGVRHSETCPWAKRHR